MLTLKVQPDESDNEPMDKVLDPGEYLTTTRNRYWQHHPDRIEDDAPEGYVRITIFAYIHGSIALSTRPFSCPWDSGRIGYAILKDDGIATEKRLENLLEYESARLNGCLYEWVIRDADGAYIESAGGYVSEDECEKDGQEALAAYNND